MHAWGWRAAFFVFLPAGVLVFALWWWYARNTPAEHPAVDAAELAVIGAGREALSRDVDGRAWLRLLRNRDTLLLAACYFAMNYVFYLFFTWFFHYLVNELGFSVLQTGFLAALPWLCGAFAAALGGWSCDRLCARLGPRWGCRLPASGGLLATAGLLWAGLYAPNAGVAVALLSLCFACTQFTEAAFWEAQTFIAGAQTAPAAGIMNTGGNLAGIVVAPLMPWLAERVGWVTALSTGVAVAAAGGLLWLLVRADRRFDADPAVELARR